MLSGSRSPLRQRRRSECLPPNQSPQRSHPFSKESQPPNRRKRKRRRRKRPRRNTRPPESHLRDQKRKRDPGRNDLLQNDLNKLTFTHGKSAEYRDEGTDSR